TAEGKRRGRRVGQAGEKAHLAVAIVDLVPPIYDARGRGDGLRQRLRGPQSGVVERLGEGEQERASVVLVVPADPRLITEVRHELSEVESDPAPLDRIGQEQLANVFVTLGSAGFGEVVDLGVSPSLEFERDGGVAVFDGFAYDAHPGRCETKVVVLDV